MPFKDGSGVALTSFGNSVLIHCFIYLPNKHDEPDFGKCIDRSIGSDVPPAIY